MGEREEPSAAHSNNKADKQKRGGGGWFRSLLGATAPAPEPEPQVTQAPAQQVLPSFQDLMALRRKPVEDVAIPKAEIVAVADDVGRDELVAVFRESGLTRLPVYNETLDKPVGFLHLKDFALKYGFTCAEGDFDLPGMLRPLLFVPPSMPISVLFQKMQNDRRHMALIIDEYGGVDGLVTIEDLIEQVLGEIEDEHDVEEDELWQNTKPGVYVALSRAPIDDFEQEIGYSLTEHDSVDEEEIDTLGGLVFMMAGRVPVRGEVLEHPTGTLFEVIEADSRRIKRIRITLPRSLQD